ncbi:MAG: SDR family NAD(P)-dependent oxidoreductase [Leptolyngbya sp. SIO1D8]|nr:SDR family NAD(P)-dependent oxidoreductase [Leptolyngbya sp. SIO1D8]
MAGSSTSREHSPRVALVTGASSGIGYEIAHVLGANGYRVALCARRRDRLETLKAELADAGVEVLAHPTDLREEAEILALFEVIRQTWGGVDVLINNAGLGHKSPLMSGETKAWQEMLAVNVLALCICTREAVKDMRQRGDNGQIVHISSLSGHRVPGASGVYAATKFAVRALTEGLRQELRAANSQVRVSAISPGLAETEFAEKYHDSTEIAQEVYGRFPVLQPQDVAEAVAYVLAQPTHVQVHDVLLRSVYQVS